MSSKKFRYVKREPFSWDRAVDKAKQHNRYRDQRNAVMNESFRAKLSKTKLKDLRDIEQ